MSFTFIAIFEEKQKKTYTEFVYISQYKLCFKCFVRSMMYLFMGDYTQVSVSFHRHLG